ncbi:SNF2 family N-terminal domain-containing protein [Myxozyma melibiosi]|uniref:SNF2 family N-terminal domain-containing protein n=1 Tax=Myxozyma melibiosi TaxID=54550 RepID=A0ABR1F6D0_9ASCO
MTSAVAAAHPVSASAQDPELEEPAHADILLSDSESDSENPLKRVFSIAFDQEPRRSLRPRSSPPTSLPSSQTSVSADNTALKDESLSADNTALKDEAETVLDSGVSETEEVEGDIDDFDMDSDFEPEANDDDIDSKPSPSKQQRSVSSTPTPDDTLLPTVSSAAREKLEQLIVRPDQSLGEKDKLPAPPGLSVELLPHQVLGYSWMCKMERSKLRGGILADDMGLGKTIQSISLIIGRPWTNKARRPTLIIVPNAVIHQWRAEFKAKVRRAYQPSVLIHHGNSKVSSFDKLLEYDVVLTTFHTIAHEYKAMMAADAGGEGRSQYVFFGPKSKFHRLILDEAQTAKNRDTLLTRGACEIDATYRWCLSGTPMQNNPGELQSLLKFLRVEPYNDRKRFMKDIGQALKDGDPDPVAIRKLQELLNTVLLRRTKDTVMDTKPIFVLPGKKTEIVKIPLSKADRTVYDVLEQKARTEAKDMIRNRDFSCLLEMIIRLKQACLHSLMVPRVKDPTVSEARMRRRLMRSLEKRFIGSTKIAKLVEILRNIRKNYPGEKVLIFSEYTQFLEIISLPLRMEGISYVQYNGSMTSSARSAAVQSFKNDDRVMIMLTSMRAGSVGLNLTCASHCIFMDPSWNPSIERQAVDRAYRYGQTRVVHVYKLIVENTIEERILAMQQVKQDMTDAALNEHTLGEVAKLGSQEKLNLLFGTATAAAAS